jgi:hypothetical protein
MANKKLQRAKSISAQEDLTLIDIDNTELGDLKKLRKIDLKRILTVIHEAKVKNLTGANLRKFIQDKLPFVSKGIVKVLIQVVLTKGVEYLIKALLPI